MVNARILALVRHRSLLVVLAGLIVFVATFGLRGRISRLASSGTEAGAGLEACRALIADFQDYPLVYLGEEFEGMPLTTCMRRQSSGTSYGIPATDTVTFIYGTCTLDWSSPDPSCEPPLQIHVLPAWMPAPVVAEPGGETRRGVQTALMDRGSTVSADASGYRVEVSVAMAGPAANQALALRAFDALRGANPLAAGVRNGAPLSVPVAASSPAP